MLPRAHSHADPAAIGSTLPRIAVVSRVLDTPPPVLAPEPGKAAAECRRHADTRRVACHAASVPERVVDADLAARARLLLDAVAAAGLVRECRLWPGAGWCCG